MSENEIQNHESDGKNEGRFLLVILMLVTSIVLLILGLLKVFSSPPYSFSGNSGAEYLIRMFKGIALIATAACCGTFAAIIKK